MYINNIIQSEIIEKVCDKTYLFLVSWVSDGIIPDNWIHKAVQIAFTELLYLLEALKCQLGNQF